MPPFFVAIRSAAYMTAFILLWGWLARGTRRYDFNVGFPLPPWTSTLGIGLIIVGGILVIACVASFVFIGLGTAAPFDPPRRFVVLGPYKYVRNPMYIGGFLVLMGYGLINRSPSMAVFSLFALLLIHFFVVVVEEKGLRKRFGAQYEEYKRSVHRWFPARSGVYNMPKKEP